MPNGSSIGYTVDSIECSKLSHTVLDGYFNYCTHFLFIMAIMFEKQIIIFIFMQFPYKDIVENFSC